MACRPGKPPAIALSRPGVLRVARGALARAGWYCFGVPCAWSLEAHERDFARWGSEVLDESPVTARHLVETMDDDVFGARFDALYHALQAAGAARMKHAKRGASFGDHLVEVARWLRIFRGEEGALVLAGLGHTCYGSELFPAPLASLTDRVDVRRALGADTERLMFLYATVSQVRWYREVLRCNRRGLQHFGEDREARSDAGRYRDDESWPIAVNFYTGETSRLHGGECAALTLMHAADIHSVLAHPVDRAGAGRYDGFGRRSNDGFRRQSEARALVLFMVQEAEEMVRALAASPEMRHRANTRHHLMCRELSERLGRAQADEVNGWRRDFGFDDGDWRHLRNALERLRARKLDASFVGHATGALR